MKRDTGWYERRVTETALSQWRLIQGEWYEDGKNRLGFAYSKQDDTRHTLTVCVHCNDALETTADMGRWKWDGKQWRHGCRRGRG